MKYKIPVIAQGGKYFVTCDSEQDKEEYLKACKDNYPYFIAIERDIEVL